MGNQKNIFLDFNRKEGEYGRPPVLVEKDHDCQECGTSHDIEKCPDCGSPIGIGFGLGSDGGYGPYKYCMKEDCRWYWKKCLGNEDE